MRAVCMLAGSDLRRRWRSVLALTVLVAFAGAVVLALTAGARRTDTSLARFEEESRSANVEIDAGVATPAQLAAFRRTPGVASIAQLTQLTLVSRAGPYRNQFLPTAAQIDDRFGTQVDRARVIEGRAAHLDAVDELTISEILASQLHIRVGDRLRFGSFSPADIAHADDTIGVARTARDLPHRRHRAPPPRSRRTGRGRRGDRADPRVPRAVPRRDRFVLRCGAASPHGARERRRCRGRRAPPVTSSASRRRSASPT